MNDKKIEFYFDFLSPYSYLAWTKIRSLDLNLDYYPISLPNIISHYKTLGPGQIEPKRNYLTRDLLRYKTIHNIEFNFPPKLPFNSLYALRLSLKSVALNKQKEMIDLFFNAAWKDRIDLSDSSAIEDLLKSKKFQIEELMDKISTKEVKLELRSNIERALNKGVFGVPTFIVMNKDMSEELFWGNDSIDYLLKYLEDKDCLPREEYQKFLTDFPM